MNTRQPISRAFNAAVVHIATRLFPTGFDVSADAPQTLEALQARIRDTGRMCVWSGASDQTSFADAEVNYAFRAWHDWCHWRYNLAFDAAGEAKALKVQQMHIRQLYGRTAEADTFCRLLDIEIMGQLRHAQATGSFPEDQWAFAVAQLVHGEA